MAHKLTDLALRAADAYESAGESFRATRAAALAVRSEAGQHTPDTEALLAATLRVSGLAFSCIVKADALENAADKGDAYEVIARGYEAAQTGYRHLEYFDTNTDAKRNGRNVTAAMEAAAAEAIAAYLAAFREVTASGDGI